MQKCNLWPHTDKTGGFQRGAMPPLWHTTLLARCSVLYLLAWLTGEAGGAVLFAPRLHRQGNGRGFCDREGIKSPSVFRERRQVYKPPSLVLRPPQGWDKVSQRRRLSFFQNPKESGKHPCGLPDLMTVQQDRAVRSMAAHLGAVHLDH